MLQRFIRGYSHITLDLSNCRSWGGKLQGGSEKLEKTRSVLRTLGDEAHPTKESRFTKRTTHAFGAKSWTDGKCSTFLRDPMPTPARRPRTPPAVARKSPSFMCGGKVDDFDVCRRALHEEKKTTVPKTTWKWRKSGWRTSSLKMVKTPTILFTLREFMVNFEKRKYER